MVIKKIEMPKKIEGYIENGGAVKEERKGLKKEFHVFALRIRKDLLKDVEQALENRIGMSTTAWILEAIQEKLRKINS